MSDVIRVPSVPPSPVRSSTAGDRLPTSVDPFARADRTIPGPIPGDIPKHLHSFDYALEVRRPEDLPADLAPWRDLLDHAVEPNVFFSPDVILPTLEHLMPGVDARFVVITARDKGAPRREPVWCGFFPLVYLRRWRGFPIRTLQLLRHDYNFLRTPLIRQGTAPDVMRLFLDWAQRDSGARLVDMGQQSGTGIYHECLADELHSRAIRPWIYETYVRAFLRRAESDEAYLRSAVSGGKLKELRRLERRLADMGPLEFHALTPDGDLSAALDEFLELERSGWKGKQGTAIACRPADSAFFRAVAKNLFERGRLRLTFLGQAGKPLAAKCNLLAPPGSFAFKIAFSEQHQKFSPGVQLEVDNIRRFHADLPLEWMDSCADPHHPMIEHLWQDRRVIASLVVPTGPLGGFIAASINGLSSASKLLRPTSQETKRP